MVALSLPEQQFELHTHANSSCVCRMARLGMNIVTVIHQPRYSIFTMFDDVLLLGAGGRTMFQGPSRAALPYFEMLGFPLPPNENPADFCLDVISGCVASKTNASLRPEVCSPLLITPEPFNIHFCR